MWQKQLSAKLWINRICGEVNNLHWTNYVQFRIVITEWSDDYFWCLVEFFHLQTAFGDFFLHHSCFFCWCQKFWMMAFLLGKSNHCFIIKYLIVQVPLELLFTALLLFYWWKKPFSIYFKIIIMDASGFYNFCTVPHNHLKNKRCFRFLELFLLSNK